MATVTLHQILDAVETTLSAAASLIRSETFDELTEGIHDCPLLQVYPAANLGTDRQFETDRTAFKDATLGRIKQRQKQYLIHADVYVNERSNLGEDMSRLVTAVDEIETILEAQVKPLFGLAGTESDGPIREFRWRWDRVTFDYAGVLYVGVRFYLTLNVY